jgi:hypothetical protein
VACVHLNETNIIENGFAQSSERAAHLEINAANGRRLCEQRTGGQVTLPIFETAFGRVVRRRRSTVHQRDVRRLCGGSAVHACCNRRFGGFRLCDDQSVSSQPGAARLARQDPIRSTSSRQTLLRPATALVSRR